MIVLITLASEQRTQFCWGNYGICQKLSSRSIKFNSKLRIHSFLFTNLNAFCITMERVLNYCMSQYGVCNIVLNSLHLFTPS